MIPPKSVIPLSGTSYVPALRWREAESQALLDLPPSLKDRIVPLITIPEIEFDFSLWRPRRSIRDHVRPFPSRYSQRWRHRPAWVGVNKNIVQGHMADGRDVFTYVFDELRMRMANAVPAIPLDVDANTLRSVSSIVNFDKLGVAILIRIEELMHPKLLARIQFIISSLGIRSDDIDLIADIGAPNFSPYEEFAKGLIANLSRLGNLQTYRNLVMIGTALPESFGKLKRGISVIPRHDWLFYQTLKSGLPAGTRRPIFGDYTIVHPRFSAVDMRMIKSAARIIYTTPDSWVMIKGKAFRDDPGQMHNHCAQLVHSGVFRGPHYSVGDTYISDCAVGKASPSNPTRWKGIGINHHITHVLDDLATYGGVP